MAAPPDGVLCRDHPVRGTAGRRRAIAPAGAFRAARVVLPAVRAAGFPPSPRPGGPRPDAQAGPWRSVGGPPSGGLDVAAPDVVGVGGKAHVSSTQQPLGLLYRLLRQPWSGDGTPLSVRRM
ncbi:hypothetical protein GCM10023196_018760 [Actinoallomurus vinaceus]|uniref:Uncharacterized protein n=1 Tax=Actinoallomurus vinaceus TaxID=1080074 RepID=A0ABP8U4C6_9ACTN